MYLAIFGLYLGILYTPAVIIDGFLGRKVSYPQVLLFTTGWTTFIATKWVL
jgi:hypothetical protein